MVAGKLRRLTDRPSEEVVFNQYVQSINRQIGHKGSIFEGKFKHIFVEKDEYLVDNAFTVRVQST